MHQFMHHWAMCKLIGKLTSFLQLQEFSLRNPTPVTSSTSAAPHSPHSSNRTWTAPSPRSYLYVLTLTLMGHLSLKITSHTHPSHSQTSRLLTSSLSLGVQPPWNPVYVRRVNPSTLVFSHSSHRHSYVGLFFNSHFIDS